VQQYRRRDERRQRAGRLLFAGSISSTIGNPIQDVIGALGISFVGASMCTAPTSASAATGFGREPLQNDLDSPPWSRTGTLPT